MVLLLLHTLTVQNINVNNNGTYIYSLKAVVHIAMFFPCNDVANNIKSELFVENDSLLNKDNTQTIDNQTEIVDNVCDVSPQNNEADIVSLYPVTAQDVSVINGFDIFNSDDFGSVRVIMRDNEPWFVVVDVCKALDIGNPTQAIDRLDEDEKMTLISNESHSGKRGGAQPMNVVNESGLYTLVLGSRKPEAKAFKRWITHDIIPSIRKHGAFITDELLNDPAKWAKVLEALAAERLKTKQLSETNENLSTSNKLLSKQILTWNDRSKINRIVRVIAKNSHHNYATIWEALYLHLLYKYHINVRARGDKPFVQHIREEEWDSVQQSLASIAEKYGLDPATVEKHSYNILTDEMGA